MFDLLVELVEIGWRNYCDNQNEPKEENIIQQTMMLWVFSFVIGCLIGLIYCEYFAVLPLGVDPPISEIYAIIIEDLFLKESKCL